MVDLVTRIDELLQDKNISGYKMCADLGMSRSFMTELRKGRAKGITIETASKLAAYFNAPVSFLTGAQPFEIWDNFKDKREILLEKMNLPKELSKRLLDGKEIAEISLIEYINFIDFTIDSIMPLNDEIFVVITNPWVPMQADEEENKLSRVNLSDYFPSETKKLATISDDELKELISIFSELLPDNRPKLLELARLYLADQRNREERQ